MSKIRIWKISADKKSKYWKEFVEGGYAALGEWDEGDLTKYNDKMELVKRVRAYSLKRWPDRYKEGSTFGYRLRNFYNELDEGDLLVLYGEGSIFAIGKVIGTYWYDEIAHVDRDYPHRVPVAWKLADPPIYDISEKLYNSLIKPSDAFHEIKLEMCIKEVHRFYNSKLLRDVQPTEEHISEDEQIKELENIQDDPIKESYQSTRYRRNRKLVEKLKKLYNFRCQLCALNAPEIPVIPMPNGQKYIEVHHIKGFNEINEGEYVIDHFRNVITVCCYHHKLLHKYQSKFSYDDVNKTFRSRDGQIVLPIRINKHL